MFAEIRRRGIRPIVDLCHFGLPDWLGEVQNPGFPAWFTEYADAFARRYPWVDLYTPIGRARPVGEACRRLIQTWRHRVGNELMYLR